MRHAAALPLALLAACASTADVDRSRPVPLVQTIDVFDRPESVAFSLDGRTLFVGNCGSDLFGPDRKKVGFVAGRGALSKLAVEPDGRVRMLEARWVSNLNGPLGLAVLPAATAKYPQGTLLVCTGLALLCDDKGEHLGDAAKLGTSILFLDPSSGRELGRLPLGVGSEAARRLGHPVLLPNSLAFDRRGNLYLTDTARGGNLLSPPVAPAPGLIRFSKEAVDDPSRGRIDFTPVPGTPNGVAYWAAEDAVCVVTMGGGAPEGEAIYAIPAGSFPRTDLPAPYASGVGTMDGIAITPAGTIVTSRFSGDLLAVPRDRKARPVALDPGTPLVAPADHRLLELADGSLLLAVPEQARTEPEPRRQRVRFIRLPKGF